MQVERPPRPTELVSEHVSTMDAMQAYLISLHSDRDSNIESIASQFHAQSQKYSPQGRGLLQRVLKRVTVDILKGSIQEPSNAEPAFLDALAIVDYAIELVRNRHIDEELPCKLLEFVFTFCTRGQLSRGVDAIRDRFNAYRQATSPRTPLYLIKAAMSCINRDQHGSDPVLSGRLRLILAAALPVWHPSGLNRRGQFNDGNGIDVESEMENANTSDFDAALYKAFWGVQEFMQNPSLAENQEVWSKVRVLIDKILDTFETINIPTDPGIAPESPSPKYMAAPSLLRLQLVDKHVRRHVLIQFVIFLHYLEAVGCTLPSEKDSPAAHKKFAFCNSLFESNGEGSVVKGRVYTLLDRDCAGKFKRFVASLIQRERKWIDWKKRTGYKHLKEPTGEAPRTFKRRRVLSPVPDSSESHTSQRRLDFPEEWVLRQKAWTVPPKSVRMDPLSDLSRLKVSTVQDLKNHLREDKEDSDITDDAKRLNNSKFVWRALRLLCEESIATVLQIIEPVAEHGVDLERCLKTGEVEMSCGNSTESGSFTTLRDKEEGGRVRTMDGVENSIEARIKIEESRTGVVEPNATDPEEKTDGRAPPRDGAQKRNSTQESTEEKQSSSATTKNEPGMSKSPKRDGERAVEEAAGTAKDTD